MTEGMSKNEIKKQTKEFILNGFRNEGMTIIERSAGAVGYQAIRFSEDSMSNVACVYGGRGVGASIWVRDNVFQALKTTGSITKDSHNVEDVSFFKRGLDWKIDIIDFNDPIVSDIINLSIEFHRPIYEKEQQQAQLKAEKAKKAAERKAKMDSKRKSAW